MRALTWEQVCARRLRKHRLLSPAGAGELAGVTRREVRAELCQRRRLVKTYGIRGTAALLGQGGRLGVALDLASGGVLLAAVSAALLLPRPSSRRATRVGESSGTTLR